jgi:hypothetical protein
MLGEFGECLVVVVVVVVVVGLSHGLSGCGF